MEKFIVILLVVVIGWMLVRPKRRASAVIDAKEARAILGVTPAADADAIRAAHRRLVAAVHPDRGGSADLARRINIARDVLLKAPRD